MRQKTKNTLFTFLYPGRYPNSGEPNKDDPNIAIPDDGEFVSICTKGGCAVFYNASDLRQLAECLHEAADLFEENQAKRKVR